MMDRIRLKVLEKLEHKFLILYGFGISDSFLTEDLEEVPLEFALLKTLKGLGFRRVLFLNPQNPLQFLDEESKQLSKHIIWEKRSEVLQSKWISEIQTGPFGNLHFYQRVSGSSLENGEPMGDLHGLRLVDYILQEHSPFRTAVIIDQADVFLTHFEDQRSMASIIGRWLRLPSYNQSQIYFVFASPDLQDLANRIELLPLPELSLFFGNNPQKNLSTHPFLFIEGPELDECYRLLQFARTNLSVEIPEEEFETLAEWIMLENQPLKTWLFRFSQISNFSVTTGKQTGWFQAFHQDSRSIEEKLSELVGLVEIKTRIKELSGWVKEKKKNGRPIDHNFHMIFIGNPGTGKTTIARLMGEILKDIGVLRKGHLVEVKASDLIAEYVGGTAIKTNSVIDKAMGGVLFIDEAYSLSAKDRGGFGQEALETLLIRMENERNNFIVIMAGYPQQMNELLESNPGLSRRFPTENRFYFSDFSEEELWDILKNLFNSKGLQYSAEMETVLKEILHQMVIQKNEHFGNAGEIRNMVEAMERKCLARYHYSNLRGDYYLTYEDIPQEYLSFLNPVREGESIDIFRELDQLKGLVQVKNYIRQLFFRIEFEKLQASNKGIPKPQIKIPHLVFIGNPGTGKTSVARLIARYFHQIGFLRRGQLVEVTAADLIAGYVGQSTEKSMKVIKSSLGGVLFIDEAYSLIRGSNKEHYGQEVIDLLVKAMDKYEGQWCIILAGYPEEMFQFLHSNPGLKSRFEDPIFFEDLSPEQLAEVISELAERDGLTITDEVMTLILEELERRKKVHGKAFGNAREAKKIYELMKNRLAERVISSKQRYENWNVFLPEDVLFNVPDATSYDSEIFYNIPRKIKLI